MGHGVEHNFCWGVQSSAFIEGHALLLVLGDLRSPLVQLLLLVHPLAVRPGFVMLPLLLVMLLL